MKTPWHTMTAGDWIVILLLLTTSLAGVVWVINTPAGTRVVVTTEGQTSFIASLDQPQTVALDGPLGQTRLVIDDQGARITASPCPRKLCIAMGPAKQTADLIACVPNRILVRIDGSSNNEEGSYDLLSR
jgi:hypothetical protein